MTEAVAPVSGLPIFARTRLVDDVTAHLREMILSEAIPPGSKLLQVELSEQLGVSRTPLREALRILEREGLVRISNGNRTVEVVTFSADELRELYEVREIIDGLAARLLAREGLSAELDGELSGALDDMEESLRRRNRQRYLGAHSRFHAGIAENCGNSRVESLLSLVRTTSSALHGPIDRVFSDPDDATAAVLQEAAQQHRLVLDKIRACDERGAEQAARRHIAATMRSGLIERAFGFDGEADAARLVAS
jgi:GntR family transcriptional regulator, vanillate catabolism transcriptional regulator